MDVSSESRNIRRKKAMSRKKTEKRKKIISTESNMKHISNYMNNDCDKAPKDMPVFFISDLLVEKKCELFKQNVAIDKPIESVQLSYDNPISQTPPQSYTPGLHKMPSIVCRPSYLTKCKNMNVIRYTM